MQSGWRERLTLGLANSCPRKGRSAGPLVKSSSALCALSFFRPSLFLLRLGSLLFFKLSAGAAPLRRSCSALILAALSAAVAGAQSADDWVIETVAGGGSSLGDGGAAAAALLSGPVGVALDGAGNLYIADRDNQRIRKVDPAGTITTVAGNGTAGFSGDGGAAAAAQLNNPAGLSLDAAGNLYIADRDNQRIRKVDPAGVITTVAGDGAQGFGGDSGAAVAAQLNAPYGVAPDGSGNLYIADFGNNRIRKVDPAGTITTVAGGGSSLGDGGMATAARLSGPAGVAPDGAGNLYIADSSHQRIRKVDSTGTIVTVAGNGTAGSGGDGGAATAAQLNAPYGLAPDGAGNLYIADSSNHRIRKVDSAGTIVTVAGSGAAGHSGDGAAAVAALLRLPRGVALDGSGNLYFADEGNQRIRKVDSAGVISTLAGRERLNSPYGLALDGAGNLYFADTSNHRIRKVDPAGVISTVAGDGRQNYGGDGGAATAAQLNSPRGVALDGAGNLHIADRTNNRIRKVDSAGVISTVAGIGIRSYGGDGGAAVAARLQYPHDVALDGAGNLYIADTFNHRIRKVDTAGTITTVAGGGSSFGDGGAAVAARLNIPRGVTLDDAGNLYIADTFNHRIRKVDTDGDISTVAGNGTRGYGGDGGAATAAQLNSPHGVALDGAGNLYIADTHNDRIRKVDADGDISTVAGNGTRGYGGDGGAATAAQLNSPHGVALDGAGNLYIADRDNHRIRKVVPPAPAIYRPPTGPSARLRAPQPAALARAFKLAFVLRQDDAPATQQIVLYAEDGAVNFRAQPAQRWIAVEPASGSLEEDEEAAVTVTVDPAGLRVGRREGLVYVRCGERLTARVKIALTVQPAAGPAVSRHGVVNAAALSAFGERGLFGPRLLPPAAGSLVVIRGVNFTAGESYAAEGFPLPASLGGVTVRFDDLQARLLAVGPQRIEAQLPSLLAREALQASATALATVVVETAEAGSYPRRFLVGAHGPGIFTMSGDGTGQAAALLAGTTVLAASPGFSGDIRLAPPAETVNFYTTSRPAQAGDVLEIYATGLGPVEPPLADGMNSCLPDSVCLADGSNVALRRTTERPRVSIGGVEVAADGVLFSGLAPTLAAVNLLLVEVPAGITPSAAAEVIIAIGGRMSQPGVTIAVESPWSDGAPRDDCFEACSAGAL